MSDESFARRILVETDDLIAWNKPPVLATTGRDLDDPNCAQYQAMQYAGEMVWALHQLDRDTSGVVLFARKKSLVASWQNRWSTAAIQKYYVALVHGRLPRSPMKVDEPLLNHNRKGYTEVTIDTAGKPAVSHFVELSAARSYSLVLARPITGRTHQLRVHLQSVDCPLIGEKRYNSIPCGHHNRHALHAMVIATDCDAPLNVIEAPLAQDLLQPSHALGIDLSILTNLDLTDLLHEPEIHGAPDS